MANDSGSPTTEMGTIGNSALFGMVGFNVAWVTGLLGSFLEDGSDFQSILYSLAAMGGAVGAGVLVARHIRAGRELAAGGFAIIVAIVISETLAGFGGPQADGIFIQLSIMFLPAFLLIACQDWSTVWARGALAVSGVAFAVYGYSHTLSGDPPDSDSPILIVAYLAWIVAIIGWSMTLSSESE